MFHLTTHAFFKALLFLGAGSVIHALSDEQDLRRMGGIWKQVPVTYVMMWIGSLALAGFPFFAGFYSKDMILEAAFAAHTSVGSFAFWLGCAAAFLTAFYSWRLLIMAFHGKPRASAEVMAHVHESPKVMTLPLFVLALGAIFSGWLGYELFVGHNMAEFWGDSIFILPTNTAMENAHHVPTWVKLFPIGLAASGVALAVLFYGFATDMPGRVVSLFRPIHTFFFNKWYFDELYDIIFVKPAVRFGAFLWQRGDRDTIDGFGPDGLSALVMRISGYAARIQSGFVFHYAFAMLIGVVVLVSWYYFRFKGV
jgi:NADH-quinone oxidoreductase subunit L